MAVNRVHRDPPRSEPRHTWVLVHSPLVGPATLDPLAEALRRQGRTALVPTLLGQAETPSPGWRESIERVAAELHGLGSIVLVGHSGAGYFLPAIAAAADGPVEAFAFIDAPLPPSQGSTPLVPSDFLPQLEALSNEGLLPPWSQWFGSGIFEAMVPDDEQRAALEGELPCLPLASLADDLPVPEGWDLAHCAYLLLSPEQYGAFAHEAQQRGWATDGIDDADHLSTVTEPDAIATALIGLIER